MLDFEKVLACRPNLQHLRSSPGCGKLLAGHAGEHEMSQTSVLSGDGR